MSKARNKKVDYDAYWDDDDYYYDDYEEYGDVAPITKKPSPAAAVLTKAKPKSKAKAIKKGNGLATPKYTPAQVRGTPDQFDFTGPSPDDIKREEKMEKVVVKAAVGVPEVVSVPIELPKENKKLKQQKKVLVAEETQKRKNKNDRRRHIHLAVCGHVDSGKSTLLGHLLHLHGRVSDQLLRKYAKQANDIGKGSFAYAWVMDASEGERERGITEDVSMQYFETSVTRVTILDTPGHKDFVSNMIVGASQADAAVLVVDAITGEFESGFKDSGQTKEHAVLLWSLGVTQVIVAVNKLDMMEWAEARFEEIKAIVRDFMIGTGFKDKNLSFVPVSGLTGVNIVERQCPQLSKWYDGPTLVELIDKLKPPKLKEDHDLRLAVAGVYKSKYSGWCVSGKIESGAVMVGEQLVAVPGNLLLFVKSLYIHEQVQTIGFAGDNVEMTVTSSTGDDLEEVGLQSVSMLCDPSASIMPMTNCFEVQVLTMNLELPILKGVDVIVHCNNKDCAGIITKLNAVLDKKTGVVAKAKPRAVTSNTVALLNIQLQDSICIELYATMRQFGRVALRQHGKTIAVGFVKRLFVATT